MTITKIRVTQTYEEVVRDYVDVVVIHDEGESLIELQSRALRLVKAQMDCGIDIEWNDESTVGKPGEPELSALVLPTEKKPSEE